MNAFPISGDTISRIYSCFGGLNIATTDDTFCVIKMAESVIEKYGGVSVNYDRRSS